MTINPCKVPCTDESHIHMHSHTRALSRVLSRMMPVPSLHPPKYSWDVFLFTCELASSAYQSRSVMSESNRDMTNHLPHSYIYMYVRMCTYIGYALLESMPKTRITGITRFQSCTWTLIFFCVCYPSTREQGNGERFARQYCGTYVTRK